MRALRTHRRAGERGTTLLEAMVATAVLLIGFVGVMSVNKIGVRMNGRARAATRATAIAQDLAEQIALWSYDDPRLTDGTHNDGTDGVLATNWSGVSTAVLKDGQPFTRTWTVSRTDDLDHNAVPDGARIVINVTGGDFGGNQRDSDVTVYTYKKNPAER